MKFTRYLLTYDVYSNRTVCHRHRIFVYKESAIAFANGLVDNASFDVIYQDFCVIPLVVDGSKKERIVL